MFNPSCSKVLIKPYYVPHCSSGAGLRCGLDKQGPCSSKMYGLFVGIVQITIREVLEKYKYIQKGAIISENIIAIRRRMIRANICTVFTMNHTLF